jgi:hypothetical protein
MALDVLKPLLLVKASWTFRLLALLLGTQAKSRGTSTLMEHPFNHLSVQNFVFAPLPTSD